MCQGGPEEEAVRLVRRVGVGVGVRGEGSRAGSGEDGECRLVHRVWQQEGSGGDVPSMAVAVPAAIQSITLLQSPSHDCAP